MSETNPNLTNKQVDELIKFFKDNNIVLLDENQLTGYIASNNIDQCTFTERNTIPIGWLYLNLRKQLKINLEQTNKLFVFFKENYIAFMNMPNVNLFIEAYNIDLKTFYDDCEIVETWIHSSLDNVKK